MKKRALSLLMSLVMLVSMLPTTAWAADETENTTPTTVNVDFTAQAAGAFLIPPQFDVAVSSDEAENFGYTDSVEGVSALDVLVKAHEIKFGEDFTKTSSADYLEVSSSGFVTKLFGFKTSNNGFSLNGAFPNDGTKNGSYYNGTTVETQAVKNNDSFEFFVYQDEHAMDNMAWFSQNGVVTNTITAKPSAAVELVLNGICFGWYGGNYKDAAELHAVGSAIEYAQLAWVNTADGTLTNIEGAVTDADGKVTLTMPADEGTSYLTAYMPASDIKDGKSPLIMSLTKMVADKNATEPDTPQVDPCALTDLVVKGYGATGYDQIQLALTPAFSSDTLSYVSEERVFRSDFTQKLLAVSLTKADKNAVVKGKLNGENEKDFTQTGNGSFNNMLPGQDNILTITVTNGEQSKTYTVTIPMAADPNTPVVPDADMKITFEEAKETVLKALAPMGEDYLAILKEGFENRWIDVYENEGKTSGAYSAGARVHPYVLLNHKDTLNCMFTLAHEMGHAIHSYLSNKNQPVVYSDYVIFVAEVASTCNEALLMQYLLKNTEDKKQRAYLINYFLEQFRTTLYRQTMFAEFELKINEMVAAGESLTAEGLNELYGELNKLYFGDGIVLDDEIKLEWARIPHFYYDYYVYQYATGYSAAIALSQRILKYGEPAVKDYIGFLKGGCSTDPISLLKGAGVDMATTQPINEALAMFGELVKEMEEAMAE